MKRERDGPHPFTIPTFIGNAERALYARMNLQLEEQIRDIIEYNPFDENTEAADFAAWERDVVHIYQDIYHSINIYDQVERFHPVIQRHIFNTILLKRFKYRVALLRPQSDTG